MKGTKRKVRNAEKEDESEDKQKEGIEREQRKE